RMGTTVAFDYGNVNITGIEAEIFGTPGQERFEFIFKIFAREVSGVLLVIDATHPDELPRAKQMLDLVGPRIPFVVLANKSDLAGALSPSDISRRMDLPPDTPVMPTVATESRGVRDRGGADPRDEAAHRGEHGPHPPQRGQGRPVDRRDPPGRGGARVTDLWGRLEETIEELSHVTDIKSAAVVRRDGLVVTHTLPEGVDPKIVAAMTAAIVGTSEMATIQLSQGRFVRA